MLRASDLQITEADPTSRVITAVGTVDDRGWAMCRQPREIVRDYSGRASIARAEEDHREVELEASVSDAPQGAKLTLKPAFSAEPTDALAAAGDCQTTQALERRILEEVATQA